MKRRIRNRIDAHKRRIQYRLNPPQRPRGDRPVFAAQHIHYELSERTRGLNYGGVGLIHKLARSSGLIDAIDQRLHLLRFHLPYHESDHVLNFAFNALCEGTGLQDIELRRNDEVFLDALGASRIPDPTTAGDFCRRFQESDIRDLQEAIHDARKQVWAQQPQEFFRQATIDMDGTIVETSGQCKQGMDITYNGKWGYHPLLLTLAETGEVLSLVNRSGNRPSQEGAEAEVDRCLQVCFEGGFEKVLLRGDTDFSQTEHLDRWSVDPRVRFLFGYDARKNLVSLANSLPDRVWERLRRPRREEPPTESRERPTNVKEEVVRRRGYENLRLAREEVAETNYRPAACQKTYRLVILKKHLTRMRGQEELDPEIRYFFFITNEWYPDPWEIVHLAHGRCNQENLIAQLSGGCAALVARLDSLLSNWAYMVMTALAWTLKAWWALSLPEQPGRWGERHQQEKRWVLGLEFRTFVQAFVRLPGQVIHTGRKMVIRLLAWNPHQPLFFRLVDALCG